MEREGFIVGYEIVENEKGTFKNLKVILKYVHGNPVINEINRVSNPAEEFIQGLIVYQESKTA